MNVQDLHRTQTERFIEEAKVEIAINRPSEVSDGSGGVKRGSDVLLDPQEVRIISLRSPRPFTTANGSTVVVSKNLVGHLELDIQIEDWLPFEGEKYVVVSVDRSPSWRTIAGLERRG